MAKNNDKDQCASGASGLLKGFRECDSASMAILVGMSLPILVGLGGLAMDAGGWYVKKRTMQTAADSAAISGAIELAGGSDLTAIESAALVDAKYNSFDESGSGVMTVSTPPSEGAYSGDAGAVEVILQEPAPMYFSSLFLTDPINIKTRAVAKSFSTGALCMIALEDTEPQAMKFTGNVDVNMKCGIASNSTDAQSIYANGSVDIQVPTAWTAGQVDYTANADFQALTLRENASKVVDPYAGLAVPSFAGCDQDGLNIKINTNISPGVYCNGLSIGSNASVYMEPGVYVIDRGGFTMSGNTSLQGDGVTIILTSSTGSDYGEFSITGNTTIGLSAPNSGTTAGVVLFQDRNSPDTGSAKINGNNETNLTGAVYFPTQQLEFGGTGDVEEMCIQLIARTIWAHGNVDMQNECQDEDTKEAAVTVVKQVE